MPGTNEFKAFATGGSANVLTPAAYAALTSLISNGFSAGVAPSQQLNTVWRQSSFVSSAIAQLIANANINAVDDGNLTTFVNNLLIALGGAAPGMIQYFAANATPAGYLKANGSQISRTTYANLFAATGTLYGAGNGSTTFHLPDLRGEFLRGWDDGRLVDGGRTIGSNQLATAIGSHVKVDGGVGGTSAMGNIFTSTDGSGPDDVSIHANYYLTAAASTNGGAAYATTRITRPRNVALLACIKY